MNVTFMELAMIAGMTMTAQVDVDHDDLICLSRNIYHEARSESRKGQLAVAYLTLNRVESPKFPNNVCDVVTEDRGAQSWDCQFSWWCDGASDAPKEEEAYQKALLVALSALTETSENPVPGATHYYAIGKPPYWSNKLSEIAVIGDHRFMQE